MKKILVLVLVVALIFSHTALAGEEDFENGTIGDWEIWDFTGEHERHADKMGGGATIENTGDINYEQGGSHALRVVLTDPTDTGWTEPQFTTTQSDFLTDLNTGDTVFYAIYLGEPHDPDTCIYVFKMFGKHGDSWDWTQDDNGCIWNIPGTCANLPNDTVKYVQWSLLTFVVPDVSGNQWQQIGICINFNNVSSENTYSENDTIYFDAITSLGRLNQAGINIKEGNIILPKTSIGSIKYSLTATTPVLIEAFDLTGRKVLSEAPGFQAAGDHELKVNGLSSGVYFVKIIAGNAKLTTKLLIL
jgi:hypothetical protein